MGEKNIGRMESEMPLLAGKRPEGNDNEISELGIEKSGENKENEIKKEYTELKEKLLELDIYSSETYAIASLTVYGGQELIDIYGVEDFMNALKKVKSRGKDDDKNIYEVMEELEPDRNKRLEMYKQINKSLEEKRQENDKNELSNNWKYSQFSDLHCTSHSNNTNMTEIQMSVIESSDKISGMLHRSFAKISNKVSGRIISPHNSHNQHYDMLSQDENAFFYNMPEYFDLNRIETDLTANKGNILETVIKRCKKVTEDKEEMEKEIKEYSSKIETQIEKIIGEINKEFLQKFQEFNDKFQGVSDSAKKRVEKTVKETKENSTVKDEQQLDHIEQVAGKMFEKEFTDLFDKHKKETEEKTKEYYELMGNIKISSFSKYMSSRKMQE